MAYPISKNRKAVTNALERDGFVPRSQSACYILFNEGGNAVKSATIEERRDGRHFAVVRNIGWSV